MDLLAIRVLQIFAFIYMLGSVLTAFLLWLGVVGTAAVRAAPQSALLATVLVGFAIIIQGVLLWAFFVVVASIGESLLLARRGE